MRPFASGGWTMLLTGHGLEEVAYRGHVVSPRVFFSVRDESWRSPEIPITYGLPVGLPGGRPPTAPDATGTFAGRVAGHPLAVSGSVQVTGHALRVAFGLEVESAVDVARAGPCVLHAPPAPGAPISTGPPGGETSVPAPSGISARPVVSGFHRLHLPADGVDVTVELDGATYEMEDQRNWGDATFKSYCPPLSEERPLRLAPGSPVSFTVTLSTEVRATAPGRNPLADAEVGDVADLCVGSPVATLPPIGLTHPGGPLDDATLARIAETGPAYVHLLVDLADEEWVDRLRCDLEVARQLAGRAVLTVDCPRGRETLLPALASACSGVADAAFLFARDEPVTSDRLAETARRALDGSGVRVGAGTRGHFASLNIAGRVPDAAEVVGVALTGAAHDDDRRAITTGPASYAAIVAEARRIAAGRDLYLGPVGLAPTFDSWPPRDAALPVRAAWDGPHRRHASRFGATWAVAAYAALAASGPARVCLAGTVGGRGVGAVVDGRFRPHPVHAALARIAALGPGPYAALPPGRSVAGLIGLYDGLVAVMGESGWRVPSTSGGRPVGARTVLRPAVLPARDAVVAGPDLVALSWGDGRSA
ncbi:MAG: hypothetical protein M0Z33_00410 [Actinomycetota bacterium]|nr:hypothetical protein [Actinomycetota bacterium]